MKKIEHDFPKNDPHVYRILMEEGLYSAVIALVKEYQVEILQEVMNRHHDNIKEFYKSLPEEKLVVLSTHDVVKQLIAEIKDET